MKKNLLLALAVFMLYSCELESDDPVWIPELAKVTAIELPEFFEEGKSYDIKVSYVLPSTCHIPQGINAYRESLYGSGRRKIYVTGVAAKKFGEESQCQVESEDLEETGNFQLLVDEDMPYTFFLWTGIDQTGKYIYTEIEVPVGEPAAQE